MHCDEIERGQFAGANHIELNQTSTLLLNITYTKQVIADFYMENI